MYKTFYYNGCNNSAEEVKLYTLYYAILFNFLLLPLSQSILHLKLNSQPVPCCSLLPSVITFRLYPILHIAEKPQMIACNCYEMAALTFLPSIFSYTKYIQTGKGNDSKS
jgi:hypothetical protein